MLALATHENSQSNDLNNVPIHPLVPPSLAFPTRKLESGKVLYEAGREAKLLYLLNDGLLKAVVPTAMGRDRLLDFYKAGDVIGFAALNDDVHTETVVAVSTTTLVPLLPEFITSDASLSNYIMLNLSEQLRRNREAMAALQLPVGARVAWFLKELSERFGETTWNHKKLLPLEITHEDIASLVHSSRVTVTRVLGELRSAEALFGGRGAYLTDPERLEIASDRYLIDSL